MANPDVAQASCYTCNVTYAVTDGRVHGKKFQCTGCASIDRMLRRGLGSKMDLEVLPREDQHDFFRRLNEEKKKQPGMGKLNWATVKASLLTTLTTKQVTSSEVNINKEYLPLSVWLTRGWEKDVVLSCPKEYNEALGTETYCVPVKCETWREAFVKVEERILAQEKQAQQKKKGGKKACAADEEDELDLPVAPASTQGNNAEAKKEKQEEKEAAKLLKKTVAENQKQNVLAAKNIGILTQDLAGLSKLKAKIIGELPEGVEKVASESLATLTQWSTAAKEMLSLGENPKVQSGELPVKPLPFDLAGIKTLHQTVAEAMKSLKTFLPVKKPAPKRKESAEESAENKVKDGEAPVPPVTKRRRGKGA